MASPALSQHIDTVLSDGFVDAREMRRVLVSASSYLLRWQRRPTPFGLFAGVAAASAGDRPTTRFGHGHRVTVRADARWLGGIIDGLERHPEVLLRLPVVVNDAGFTRGDRFVVPARPNEAQPGRGAALDVSVHRTKAVRTALAGAAEPVRVAALAQRIGEQFPSAPPEKIHVLPAELVASRILITSLRAPMTTVDTLAAGQEWFECGDVWHRVARRRPIPANTPTDRLAELTESIRKLLAYDARPTGALFGMDGPLSFAESWAAAFNHAGEALAAAANEGTLERGTSDILAHHVIFHWNRIGLSATTQSILANVAKAVVLG